MRITGVHRISHETKDNRYFVVDNAVKIDKKRNGKRSEYPDDCRTWLSIHGNCNRTSNLVHSEENFEKFFVRDGLYCKEKKVNRKRTFVPVSSTAFHRCYDGDLQGLFQAQGRPDAS